MIPFIQRPYPVSSARSRWWAAVLFGLFVFLFLQIFQPFGLSSANESLWPYTLGYGFITFCMTALLSFVPQYLFPAWFDEDQWTVGREIFITIIVLLFIALGNWIYSAWLGITSFGWNGFLAFVGYTLAVGVFPIGFGVLAREYYLSRAINRRGERLRDQLEPKPEEEDEQIVAIHDQDGDFIMELAVDDILAVTNAENYVELFYREGEGIERTLVRSTLSSFAKLLSAHPRFFRVHRSWIANLNRIREVEGNARGYDLTLHTDLPLIPVSRHRIDAFEERMQSLA